MSDDRNPQRVVCAANRHKDTGRIILGIRHWDQFMRNSVDPDGTKNPDFYKGWDQGFVDQYGTFLTREEAFGIAAQNHQIIRPNGMGTFHPVPYEINWTDADDDSWLFSENLY